MIHLRIFDYSIDDTGQVIDTNEIFIPELSTRTVISLNRDVLDLQDISKQSTDFTYSFIIPALPETMKFFRNFGNLNYVGRRSYISYRAELSQDGELIFAGRFVLQSYDQNKAEYTGQLFGKLSYLIYKLRDKKMKDLAYLQQFKHNYMDVENTLVGSWDGKCVRSSTDSTYVNPNLEFFYPLIDIQGQGYYHNENVQQSDPGDASTKYVPWYTPFTNDTGDENLLMPFNLGESPMAVKYVPLVKEILREAGFIVEMAHYEQGNKWPNLFIQLPKLKKDDKSKSQALSDGSLSSQLNITKHIPNTPSSNIFEEIKFDEWSPSIYIKDNRYIVPVDGAYKVRIAFEIDFIDNGFPSNYSDSASSRLKIYLVRKKKSDGTLEYTLLEDWYGEGRHYTPQPALPIDLSLKKDDELYIIIVNDFPNSAGSDLVVKYNVVTSSFFNIIHTPPIDSYGEHNVAEYFKDTTQLDILTEFFRLSKATILYKEINDEVTIEIKPILDQWKDNTIPQMDLTDKVDRSSKFEVRPATELMPKTIEYKWKEGKDVLSQSFKAKVGRGYGDTYSIGTGMAYAGKDYKVESKLFAPHPTGAINYSEHQATDFSDVIVFRAFKNVEKFDEALDSYSLFLWDGEVRTITDTIRIQGLASAVADYMDVTYYPMAHNMLLTSDDNYEVMSYTEDINWEWSVPYSVDSAEERPMIGNELFDQYHRKYIDALYEMDTILVDTAFRLTPREFSMLNIWAPVMLDGSRYRILNYKDYDVVGNKPVKMLLLKDNIGEGVTVVSKHPITMEVSYLDDGLPSNDSVIDSDLVITSYGESVVSGDNEMTTLTYSGDVATTPTSTYAMITLPDNSTYGSLIADLDTSGADQEIYNNNGCVIILNGAMSGAIATVTVTMKLDALKTAGNPDRYYVKFEVKNTSINVANYTTIPDTFTSSDIRYYENYTASSYTVGIGISSASSYNYWSSNEKVGRVKLNMTNALYDWSIMRIKYYNNHQETYLKDIHVGDMVYSDGTIRCEVVGKLSSYVEFEFYMEGTHRDRTNIYVELVSMGGTSISLYSHNEVEVKDTFYLIGGGEISISFDDDTTCYVANGLVPVAADGDKAGDLSNVPAPLTDVTLHGTNNSTVVVQSNGEVYVYTVGSSDGEYDGVVECLH